MVWFSSAVLLAGLAGCGIPATPQPPSLNLPQVVDSVQAQRVGSGIALQWTAPVENTDKTKVKPGMTARVCRSAPLSSPCVPVATVPAGPGQPVDFTDVLPATLQQDPPQPVAYQVAMQNARGRSAGWSAPQLALAGPTVPAVEALTAENMADGVKLAWKMGSSPETGNLVFRITRTRLTPGAAESRDSTPFGAEKIPAVQSLEVSAPDNVALDNHTAWGEEYRYQVQAVRQVTVAGVNGPRKLEMLGAASGPADVQTKDTFPPAAPKGLVAVPVWAADGTPGVDLSWEPNTDAGIAGYQVIRIRKFPHRALEQRQMISGAHLITAPSFEDHGLQPGTTYVYSVVAVDKAGNVSPESNQVTEMARSKDQ